MLGRVAQVAVTVQDVGRATAFYRDALGLPLLFEVPGLAFFDCAGMRLMLAPPEGEFQRNASVLYFAVADLEEAYGALSERGVAFIDRPHKVADLGARELWLAFFRDSEGNVMALSSEVAKGG